MGKHIPDDRLSEFEARLKRLKDESSQRAGSPAGGKQSGYGMAFAIAADLVGGVVGGAGLGWLVDRWLGSAPWGLIVFFFLGAAAGMWNVYRTVRGYDMSFGFSRPPAPGVAKRGKPDTPAGARPEKEGGDNRGQSTASVRSAADHPDPHRRR
jgi:ATP synthase protein I